MRTNHYRRSDSFLGQWQLQVMALFGILFVLVFNYTPMFGVILAFKQGDYALNLMDVIKNGKWVGFAMFREFFKDEQFVDVLFNTLGLNLLQLVITFPAPILFALMINEVGHLRFKKLVQSLSYFPYFLSWVVFGGIMITMLSNDLGVVNPLLMKLGLIQEPVYFVGEPKYFWGLIIVTSLIKGLGWGSIIYLASIASIDPTLYEAATIDGANRFQRIWHITLPSILGTILIFFLLSIGSMLNSAFDQIYVFQSPINLERSEVIDTLVYKVGIAQMRFSYTTAVGLFKSVVSMLVLTIGHFSSKRFLGRGLF